MEITFKKKHVDSDSNVSSVRDSVEIDDPPEIIKNDFVISEFMNKMNKVQAEIPKFKVIEKWVRFHEELIHKMIDENKSLKELVHITLAQTHQRMDQISIELSSDIENSFK